MSLQQAKAEAINNMVVSGMTVEQAENEFAKVQEKIIQGKKNGLSNDQLVQQLTANSSQKYTPPVQMPKGSLISPNNQMMGGRPNPVQNTPPLVNADNGRMRGPGMEFRVSPGVNIMGGGPSPTGTVSPPQSGQPYMLPGVMGAMKQAHDRQGLPVPPYTPSGAGLGGATPQPPQPPQPPPPNTPDQIPLRRTPSKWDMMKESMFAGEDQRGLFGKAGVDPKTGKDSGYMGLSGYFNRLFDDPGRMAMLSGGLSAMDPSSYYDKQGFGSPWTGLRGAFGAAQGGAKSVHDARKAKADLEKTKAETISGVDDKRLMSVRGGVLDRKIYGNALKRGVDPGEAKDLAFLATDSESASKFSANQLEKMEGDYYTDQYALSMINETLKILEPYDVTAWADIQVLGEDVGSKLGFNLPRSSSKKVRDNMQSLLARLTEMKLGMNLSTRLLDTQGEKQWLAKITSQPKTFGSNYGKIKKDLKDLKNVLDSLQGNRRKHNKILSEISGDTGADTTELMKGGDMTLDEFIAQED